MVRRWLEVYTDHNAFTDGNGSLVITAKQETAVGPLGGVHDYTSSRLTTEGHYSWQYGRAEARILTPAGAGLWPAFWGVGVNGGWPASGEIDTMEMKGQAPSTDYATVHGTTNAGLHWQFSRNTSGTMLTGSWHTYATVWQPDAVATLVDGQPFFTVTPADLPAENVWGFDQPFYVLLDLAVGGDFVGSPTAATTFPAQMKVDWLRITQ
jgi:beta-glucanase (GH16 family)